MVTFLAAVVANPRTEVRARPAKAILVSYALQTSDASLSYISHGSTEAHREKEGVCVTCVLATEL